MSVIGIVLFLFVVTFFPLTKQLDLNQLQREQDDAKKIVLHVAEKLKGNIKIKNIDYMEDETDTYICATGVELKGIENPKFDIKHLDGTLLTFTLSFDNLFLQYGQKTEVRNCVFHKRQPGITKTENKYHPMERALIEVNFLYHNDRAECCEFSFEFKNFDPKMEVNHPEYHHTRFGKASLWGMVAGFAQSMLYREEFSKVISFLVVDSYKYAIEKSLGLVLDNLFEEASKTEVLKYWKYKRYVPKSDPVSDYSGYTSQYFEKYCIGNQ